MYGPPPPCEGVTNALWGASPEDVSPPVAVWPDVWPILTVFTQLDTQWRAGFSGAYGLDYSVLPWLFKMNGITDERRAFADIRTMEQTALAEMAAQREAP